jgi:subtilisin family serine protease
VGAEAPFVEGELVVRFKPGVSAAEQSEIAATRGGRVERALLLPRTKLVRLPAGASVRAAAAAFSRRADVEFAEPNWIYRLSAVPNDTRFGELHGLNQANDADIDAPQAWDVTTGNSSVIVAVLDSGVAYQHPDLAGNMWQNDDPPGSGDNDSNGFVDDAVGWDFIQNDNTPFDYNGHGTHVAGTIGAQGNNALGVTGVNWDVSVMALRAADANGSVPNTAAANAITYACANGADIVNGSFGGGTLSMAIQTAVNSAPCQNTLFVFAAGNEDRDLDGSGAAFDSYPCELHRLGSTNVLCIGATTPTDTRASFSNHGTAAVHLFAPGVDILSSWPAYTTIWSDDFDYATDTLFNAAWGDKTFTAGDALWDRTTAVKDSGTHSLTDSPGGLYADSTDTTIRRILPFNLVGQLGCRAFYDLRLDSELGFDGLILMTGTATTTTTNAGSESGSTGGAFIPVDTSLSMMDGQLTVYLRLRFFADGSINGDGAYVDDLLVGCLNNGGEDYNAIDGTSMATPHAAGVAALLLAQNPSRSVSDLKTLLTMTADPIAALNGFGINAARLNACKALGRTAAQCDPVAQPPPPPIVQDTTPPGVSLAAKAVAKLGAVLAKGYPFQATCSETCTLVAQLRLAPKLAKKLKLPQVVGQAAKSLQAGQATKVVVKLKAKAKRKFKNLRKVVLQLVTTGTDAAGNQQTVRKKVVLRR